jgi:peptide/nickel transport system permease protein
VTKYIVRRAIGLLPLLLGIVLLSFTLMKLAPGGPQTQFQGNKKISQEQIDVWLKRWCLSRETTPLTIVKEFGGWFGILNCNRDSFPDAFFTDQGGLNLLPGVLGGGSNGIIHGDLGYSVSSGRTVTELIAERIPATLILTITALILWVGIAILIGVYAAVHRYSLFDQGMTFLSYVFYSLPVFWFALILIFVFAVTLRWFPSGGIVTPRAFAPFNTPQFWAQFGQNPLNVIGNVAWHLVLPVITLVGISIAGDSRFVRASMLESLGQDYVRTAKAKGLSSRTVIMKHAFRNALLPVVTNIALELPFLFSGAIVTETLFTWPGMGRLFIESINDSDYFVLMGLLIVTSVLVLFANLLADVIYAVVDPRIRYD